MDLFTLVGKIIVDNDEANRALDETSNKGEKAEGKLSKSFSAIGKDAAVVGEAIVTGLAVGATAIAGLATAAIKSYSEYEQLVGGVETLFGARGAKSIEEYAKMVGKTVKDVEAEFGMLQEAQSAVMENASRAYETAGLSMNEYMETANGLAAALNQSSASQLESAALADQAIIDMADNSAKMGTSLEAIQTAYAGFAKQNYTMLDNLKLGYGGTKEEMQRLLDDAGKLAGTKFDISSFADVTEAIHVIQEEMGIAGTTAKEASGTIQGSFGMLKGAWSNLMVGLSDPEADLGKLIDNVFKSVTTFAENLIPRISQVLTGIATSIKSLVPMITAEIPGLFNQVLPPLIEGAVALVDGLVSALPGVLGALLNVLPSLIDGIMRLVDALIGALPGILQTLLSALPTLLPQLIEGVLSMILMLVEMLPQIIQPIIDALPTIIISIVEALTNNLPALIQGLIQLIMGIVSALPQIIKALVDAIPTIVSLVVEALLSNLPAIIMGLIQVVAGIVVALPQIFGALISAVPAALSGIWDGIKSVFGKLGNWFSDLGANIKTAFTNIISAAGTWIANMTAKAKEVGSKFIDTVINFFKELPGKIGTWLSNVISKVTSWAANLASSARTAASNFLNSVVNTIASLPGKVWTWLSNVISKVASWAGQMVSKGKAAATQLVTAVVSTIKAMPGKVASVGKNLVQGIWNGISGSLGWIKSKITGWVGDVTSFLKNLFGIHSPSTVMRDEVGREIARGVGVGIEENTKAATDAMQTLGDEVLKTAKANIEAEKKNASELNAEIVKVAKEKLDNYKTYNKLTIKAEAEYWDKIRKQFKEGSAERIEADKAYFEARDKINDDFLSSAEDRLDKYQTYNEMTLVEEVGFWDEIRQQCEEGTDARLKADKKYFEAKKNLSNDLIKSEETLFDKLNSIYDKLEDKTNSILNTFGQFKKVDFGSEITTAYDMIVATQEQITAFEAYDSVMERLEKRIGGTTLWNQVKDFGVDNLHHLQTIDSMNDAQLKYYTDIVQKRADLAGSIAEKQLAPEIQKEVDAAYSEYGNTIEELGLTLGDVDTTLSKFQTVLDSIVEKFRIIETGLNPQLYGAGEIGNSSMSLFGADEIGVSWYAKAYDNAMLLNNPTIFGFSKASGNLLGGGDGNGSEVVAGSNTLMQMIQTAVAQQNGATLDYMRQIIELLVEYFPQILTKNTQLCLDSGVLVGELAAPMDKALGKLSSRKDRGR